MDRCSVAVGMGKMSPVLHKWLVKSTGLGYIPSIFTVQQNSFLSPFLDYVFSSAQNNITVEAHLDWPDGKYSTP